MQKLTLTSIQAPNQDHIPAALAAYLESRLGIQTEFVSALTWQERERLLDAGQIDIGWICGLPYIQMADRPGAQVELLAAPVMRDARYKNQPIYFSDVIVHHESRYRSFEDLRGCRWAYNEPNSHSGYNLTRYMLAQRGETAGFFGPVIPAGSHQAALQMLLAGQIDATAIDSTVLEVELDTIPSIAGQIRIISTWGPSPIPPWVIQKKLPAEIKSAIQKELLRMEVVAEGKEVLASLGLRRFAQVSDRDYDLIRAMFHKALAVQL
ncbi:MAG TPA: PhnD/SsuA/transferrin family substrate-binding protein [Anaerolineales bacterium]|nr:PhnD/SsuA/transferrin family substrate-binding protein [Anaerolineales bacterium]